MSRICFVGYVGDQVGGFERFLSSRIWQAGHSSNQEVEIVRFCSSRSFFQGRNLKHINILMLKICPGNYVDGQVVVK